MQRALSLVDHLCSDSPIVVNDLQWADDASLLVWERPSRVDEKLPLPLVGVCRRPRPESLVRLRRDIQAGRGVVLDLEPSHILTKLDARSRSEIAREAADHPTSDLTP